MTPKEKTRELLQKYIDIMPNLLHQTGENIVSYAKNSALITVNEIIDTTPMYTGNLNPKWKYWSEVRQELELL